MLIYTVCVPYEHTPCSMMLYHMTKMHEANDCLPYMATIALLVGIKLQHKIVKSHKQLGVRQYKVAEEIFLLTLSLELNFNFTVSMHHCYCYGNQYCMD